MPINFVVLNINRHCIAAILRYRKDCADSSIALIVELSSVAEFVDGYATQT